MARNDFPAGLVLDAHKAQALREPVVEVPPPRYVALALDQGSGSEAEPVVPVGASVRLGTIVARPSDPFAAVLHAPVSGRVAAIEVRETAAAGGLGRCMVIENDGGDTRDEALQPCLDYAAAPPDELIARLREAGIAGLGGAAFPTATKLATARERDARRLLLNGAECEPWICCDDALMRSSAGDVVLGAKILMHALAAESCVIAIEDDKPEAIAAVGTAARDLGASVTVTAIPAVYPQGAERQLVTTIFGDEVPARGLPADIGVTCQNVSTAAAVARWARTGEPCTSRVVTVTGSGVARPRNVLARIGTPLSALIEAAGGYRGEPLRLITGGNMTGRAAPSDELGLTKAMNCVLAATFADLDARLVAQELPCIRCGDCATVCPTALLPQQLHRAALAGDAAGLLRFGIWDCIDCGCCDFVCPSQIPLAWRFREARRDLRAQEAAAEKAAAARERFERRERRLQDAAAAEQCVLDAVRQQARANAGTPATPPTDRAE